MPTTASVLTTRPRRMPVTCTTNTTSEARMLTGTTQINMALPNISSEATVVAATRYLFDPAKPSRLGST